jgi:hypothetical protein
VRLAQHHRGSFDRPKRGGSERLLSVIARMLSRLSLPRMISLPISTDTKFLLVSRQTGSESLSNVPALASPRPLTAVCG